MQEFLEIGQIVNTFGIKGMVKVKPFTDDINRFDNLEKVYVESNKTKKQYEIEEVKYHKDMVLIKFKGIDNINDVLAYKGSSLMVTRENAVKLNKDEYFIADLIGLHVSDDENKLEGKLVDVLETGANDVYVIALSDGRELLLPAIRECVLSVDLQAQEMKIHVLEGLLDEHKN